MSNNPDVYLLYEYMEKLPFTVRIKLCLDAPVEAPLLEEAAEEAISRLPYFSVKIGLDEKRIISWNIMRKRLQFCRKRMKG